MSFEVVLVHFWTDSSADFFLLKIFRATTWWAVPSFMFVSFLLTGDSILRRNTMYIMKRLKVLAIVHVVWTVVYFVYFVAIAYFLGDCVLGSREFAGKSIGYVSLSFAAQLFLGRTINRPMWFQTDLIYLTVIFTLIYYKLRDKTAMIFSVCMFFAALTLQYSGINFMLFGSLYQSVGYPLGRIVEMIPAAVLGILFVRLDIMSRLEKHRYMIITLSVVCIALSFVINKLLGNVWELRGFSYPGGYLLIVATATSTLFYLLPAYKLPNIISKFLKCASKLTLGVYCMHVLVATLIRYFLLGKYSSYYGGYSFFGCVGIYVLCLAISFAISKMSGKYSKYIVG